MSVWKRLKRILFLKCHEAAELSSLGLDEPLSRTDRLAWAGHLLVCRSCRRFRRQMEFLRTALARVAERVEALEAADAQLGDDARARIAQALRDAAG